MLPTMIRKFTGTFAGRTNPVSITTPIIKIKPAVIYVTIRRIAGAFTIQDYLFSLNLNGIAAQTATGPLFIIAGVKTY